jgi:hypothetical protein
MNLTEAKHVIGEMKEHAEAAYNWNMTKDNLEEAIGHYMDLTGSEMSKAWLAVDTLWEELRQAAARDYWLDLIKESVEKENTNKNSNNTAI